VPDVAADQHQSVQDGFLDVLDGLPVRQLAADIDLRDVFLTATVRQPRG